MDVDTNDPFFVIPRLLNFVVDPLSFCGVLTNQNDST